MKIPTRILAGALAVATLCLAGCTIRMPFRESLETAIPAAFLAGDLGITGSQAGTSTSGFAMTVWASAEFENDTVTAEDLRTMLQLAVENTDLSRVTTLEISATVGPFQDSEYIDLGAVGVELGFEADDELGGFTAPYDEVVDFLEE
jgi:hypothetical protein